MTTLQRNFVTAI